MWKDASKLKWKVDIRAKEKKQEKRLSKPD